MRLYDSLSARQKAIDPKKHFSMYVCGITPYDTTHLGHAFVYMQFDALVRYLQYKGIKVNYTQNVTDIDDDILKRARDEKRDWQELGNYWTERFVADLQQLNIRMPDQYIKATDAMNEIIEIVSDLLKKEVAYKSGGNVYFDISRYRDYGKLSKLEEGEMEKLLQERGGDVFDENKKNKLDFILWQKSLPDEPSWDSPFGAGRPGWHIECSAMIHKTLGAQIDLHGGGGDLIFPHHESEIAQSESYTGFSPFVRTWMHIGMLRYKGEKMSKSLKNLVLIYDLFKEYSPETIRWMLLSHHYSEEWEYTEAEIKKADIEAAKLNTLLSLNKDITVGEADISDFENIMDANLNTPRALQLLSKLISSQNNPQKAVRIATILGFV